MPPGSERFALADVHQFQIGLHHSSSHPYVRRIHGAGHSSLWLVQGHDESIWRAASLHPHHAEEIADTFLTLFCRELKSRLKGLTINAAGVAIFPLNLA